MMGTPPSGALRRALGMAPPFMAAAPALASLRRGERQARMHADGGEQVGVQGADDDGHGAARRQAGDEHFAFIDRMLVDDLRAMPAIGDGSPGRAAGRWR